MCKCNCYPTAALELEERKPRVEEDIELVDADPENPRHEEVPQFVDAHQDGEAEEKDVYKRQHRAGYRHGCARAVYPRIPCPDARFLPEILIARQNKLHLR